jgi:hypothetical protein
MHGNTQMEWITHQLKNYLHLESFGNQVVFSSFVYKQTILGSPFRGIVQQDGISILWKEKNSGYDKSV